MGVCVLHFIALPICSICGIDLLVAGAGLLWVGLFLSTLQFTCLVGFCVC